MKHPTCFLSEADIGHPAGNQDHPGSELLRSLEYDMRRTCQATGLLRNNF